MRALRLPTALSEDAALSGVSESRFDTLGIFRPAMCSPRVSGCQIDASQGGVSALIKMFDTGARHAGGGRSFPALHAMPCDKALHPSRLDIPLTAMGGRRG